MLLLRVLQDESRGALSPHRGLIMAIIASLRTKMAADSDGGREVTREELRSSVLEATSAYHREAIEAIAAELQRDYQALSEGLAPGACAMERGISASGGRRRLLP